MDLPTRLDLQQIGRGHIIDNAKRIDPKQVDTEGSDINIIVGSTAVVAYQIILQLAYKLAGLFLDSCFGEMLDRYAWDRYQEIRKGASSARTTVQFTRPTFDAGAGTIAVGTKISTLTGIEYITITEATFGEFDLASSAKVKAVQAGKDSQAGKNTLRRFTEPGLLFDSTITVNNSEAAAGGEPQEDDDTFKTRLRNFFITARRGTLKAIEQGGLQVPGVVSSKAEEVLSGGAEPARIVKLYVADGSGIASTALAYDVRINLDDWRAAGIGVSVVTSIPYIVTIKLKLVFKANVDTDTLARSIKGAIETYVNNLPVNGTLTIGGLYSVLEQYKTSGLIISQNMIVEPVADIVPELGMAIRTTPANVLLVN